METTCIDFLEKLSSKNRAAAWRTFTRLSRFILMKKQHDFSLENISALKDASAEFNDILSKEDIDPYFDTSISDDSFIEFLTNEFANISNRKHIDD